MHIALIMLLSFILCPIALANERKPAKSGAILCKSRASLEKYHFTFELTAMMEKRPTREDLDRTAKAAREHYKAGNCITTSAEEVVEVLAVDGQWARVRRASSSDDFWMSSDGLGRSTQAAGTPPRTDEKSSGGSGSWWNFFSASEDKDPAAIRCKELAASAHETMQVTVGVPFEKIDAPKAIEACRAAHAKFPKSQLIAFRLARSYAAGKQPTEGFRTVRPAAEAGHAPSQMLLGTMYAYGDASGGSTKDYAQAAPWFRRAADQGHPMAQFNLGGLYYQGLGVPKDYAAAAALFAKAAPQFPAAQFWLGVVYERGEGVPKDLVKAEELYSLAAARGEAEAQENLQALRTRKSIAGMALPQSVRGIVENLLSDQPVSFTDEAYLFLAGLANYFSNSCSLPESVADKSVIGTFLYGANQRAIFGNNYKGIDIGGQITGAGIMGLGVEAGRTVGCSSALTTQLSNAVVKAVKSNSSGSGGGPSIFVRTCSNQFDETRCNCLANLGRAVISDIYQQPYSRNVIVRIVNGNPFLALQVGLICNIVNY